MWKETKWFWGEPHTWTVYRLELEPGTIYDLHHVAFDEWRLAGVGD